NPTMGQSSTAQDSMLRKGSGYVLDGEDGHDPPNRLHTFCPITPFLVFAQTVLYGAILVGLSVMIVWHELAHVDEGGALP
uniref:hypothetical protein n=1 Tax=unclassified Leucobacter TaxID=2621730 RepID=UPI001BFE030E